MGSIGDQIHGLTHAKQEVLTTEPSPDLNFDLEVESCYSPSHSTPVAPTLQHRAASSDLPLRIAGSGGPFFPATQASLNPTVTVSMFSPPEAAQWGTQTLSGAQVGSEL